MKPNAHIMLATITRMGNPEWEGRPAVVVRVLGIVVEERSGVVVEGARVLVTSASAQGATVILLKLDTDSGNG
jgi:aromatic ring hydroxylase